MLESLVRLLAPWQEYFSNSVIAPTVVTAAHLTSLLVAGGLAIAHDRSTLKGVPHDIVHRPVTLGLLVVIISGLLLAAADVEVYATSYVFWIKMGLIGALLVNGSVLFRRPTRTTARISMTLWLTITVAGVVLTNA